MHTYDAVTLARYIQNRGDMCDPLTRTPYTPFELRRLERAASLQRDALTSVDARRTEEQEVSMLMRVFEDEIDDAIHTILELPSNVVGWHFHMFTVPAIVHAYDSMQTLEARSTSAQTHETVEQIIRRINAYVVGVRELSPDASNSVRLLTSLLQTLNNVIERRS
jgi:hypothetical protein